MVSYLQHIIISCVLIGLALFILEQGFNIFFEKRTIYLVIAVMYVLTFCIVGILAVCLILLLKIFSRKVLTLQNLILLDVSYNLAMLILVIRFNLNEPSGYKLFKVHYTLVIISLVVFSISYIWIKRENCNELWKRIIIILFLIIATSWAVLFPEQVFIKSPYCFWASAAFLALAILTICQMRINFPFSIRADIAAVAMLLIFIPAFNLGAGWIISYDGGSLKRCSMSKEPLHAKRYPNIIFIVWDTVRRDHLSVYGYKRSTTPYLKERSQQSIVYTNAISVAPWTLPSHASMFTGLYPRSHGVHRYYNSGMSRHSKDYKVLHNENTTLAEILTKIGYRCGGVSANITFAGPGTNLDQGFEYYHAKGNQSFLLDSRFDLMKYFIQLLKPWVPPHFYFSFLTPTITAEQVNALSLEWIDSIGANRPFFLFLNYMDAHGPYYPPGNLVYHFPGFQTDLSLKNNFDILTDMLVKDRPISERERSHLISQYDAELVYLDQQLKSFEEELKKRGLFDSAFIVLVSDHGEFFGEHNLLDHGKHLYSEVLEIPLIIKYPGGEPSGLDTSVIENRAMFDIVLRQAGINHAKPYHSWSAFSEMYGGLPPSLSGGRVIVEYAFDRRAVFFNKFKFIYSSDGTEELYDLEDDPSESINLVHINQEEAREGIELIEQFQNSIPKMEQGKDNDQQYNPGELEKLRALGYVQ